MTNHIVMLSSYLNQLPDAWVDVSNLFIALGDPHRQRILLSFEVGERLNVGQIVSNTTLSRTAVSHHLRVLNQAGALQAEKVGREVYYWIDKPHITGLLQRVLNYVEQNT